MTIFNSYVKLPEGKTYCIPTWGNNHFCDRKNEIFFHEDVGNFTKKKQDMMMQMYQHIWECNVKIMRHTMHGAGSISEG